MKRAASPAGGPEAAEPLGDVAVPAGGGGLGDIAVPTGAAVTEGLSADVVVVGGGIVGCASAYFLTLCGFKPLVIERCGVACAASGRAGGFLAREWGSGATQALHHQGFDLHEKLASDLGIESFRRLPTLSVGARPLRGSPPTEFPWVDKAVSKPMDDDCTAQVNPKEITVRMMDAAIANGASLVVGTVEGVKREGSRVAAVVVDGKQVACETVVFALGPWSVLVEKWLPEVRVPMQGVLSSSLLFRMPAPVEPPCALFCGEDDFECHLEVNPRKDATVYVCGLGGSKYLNEAQIAALPPSEVKPNLARVKAAWEALRTKTSVTGDVKPECGACIRPCPPDGMPLIGKVPGLENVVMACGHNCWGILWGPFTGQIVAELVGGKQPSAPLRAFAPDRFCAPKKSRGRHMRETPVGEQW